MRRMVVVHYSRRTGKRVRDSYVQQHKGLGDRIETLTLCGLSLVKHSNDIRTDDDGMPVTLTEARRALELIQASPARTGR